MHARNCSLCDGAAFEKRKRVAIPDDELARLGLTTSSSEPPEAAKLFWAGEELMALGDGRFYPCRHTPPPNRASLPPCWDQKSP